MLLRLPFFSDYTATIAKVKTNIVHQFTLCFYISESRINTELKPTEIGIWIQFEGCEATKIQLNSTSDIDDVKKVALNSQPGRDLYQAYYRNKQLGPGELVPFDTKDHRPILLKKIIKPQLDIVIQPPVRKYLKDRLNLHRRLRFTVI